MRFMGGFGHFLEDRWELCTYTLVDVQKYL